MNETIIFNAEEKQVLQLLNGLKLTEQISILEDSVATEKEPMHKQILEDLISKLKKQLQED